MGTWRMGIKVKGQGLTFGERKQNWANFLTHLFFFIGAAGLNAPGLSVMSLAVELRDAARPLGAVQLVAISNN